jgi:aryl-alcohol dehydrogenase-like predicted oxidoreductase
MVVVTEKELVMKKISLGKSGVEVSAFCLGTMRLGSQTDRETSFRILDMYVESGGTFLDTANIYGWRGDERVGGFSESLLGEWMHERSNRSRMFVATKVGFSYQGVEQGLEAGKIAEECEKSLKRLGTDVIDLYYAHVDDRNTPMEESLEAFDRLVDAGKVRFIGASNFLAWRLQKALSLSRSKGWAEYFCIQQRHSYLRPKPGAGFSPQIAANTDLLDYCVETGTTLLAYSPLLKGAYTRSDRSFPEQYAGADTEARLIALKAVAEEAGCTINQAVLAWMAQSYPPVIPLVAAGTMEQMEENLGVLNVTLNPDQMNRLNRASA